VVLHGYARFSAGSLVHGWRITTAYRSWSGEAGYPFAAREKEYGMPLRVELKPFERIIIGKSVITNSETRTAFLIDGDAPILREKDILTSETANSPAKRIYLCVQMMYLEDDIQAYQDLYLGFIKELIEAVPSFRDQIEVVSNLILSGQLYKGLRELRSLIKREDELLR
jgi:flagellar protein FlbT